MSPVTRKIFLAAALSLAAMRALAQTSQDPSAGAKIHIGPLAMTPTIALVNAGIDTNVFNEADQDLPKRDFTITMQPAASMWLHVGRSILIGNVTEDVVYYRTYSNQRSANTSLKIGILVPLTRLTLRGNAGYIHAKDRPGFEIDARLQRRELLYDGGVELRALAKTFIGVKGTRQNVDYSESAVFLGSNIRNELNRTVTGAALTIRHQLTPLTSINLDVGKQQDRFEFSQLRDSDSTQVNVGFVFDPFALLKGAATVGYRNFQPRVEGLQNFRGVTAAVDLSYVAFGTTKLSIQGARDVQYSFDVDQPYFLQTGGTISLTQQIFGPVDVMGRIGVQRLDYQSRAGAIVVAPNRSDYIHLYGGGFGYHLGTDVRIGFNVDKATRRSALTSRTYSGLRYGTSATYGF